MEENKSLFGESESEVSENYAPNEDAAKANGAENENEDKTEHFSESEILIAKIKKYALALLPLLIGAIIWTVIIVANTMATASKAQDKFDIVPGKLTRTTYADNGQSEFKYSMTVKNNSKYNVKKLVVKLRFVDTENKKGLGEINLNANGDLDAAEESSYTATFRKTNFDIDDYNYLQTADLDNIKIRVELLEVYFYDTRDVDYANNSWFLIGLFPDFFGAMSGWFYIFLLALTIIYSTIWLIYVIGFTRCKACNAVLAIEEVGSKVFGSNEDSLNKPKEHSDESRSKNLIMVKAEGENVARKIMYRCTCCGNITYEAKTEMYETD